MERFFDLRFVIGLFFSIIGGLLLVYSVMVECFTINVYSGGLFVIFGIFMLVLTYKKIPIK